MSADTYHRAFLRLGRGAAAVLLALLAIAPGSPLHAAQQPQISIIIDDLGNHRESGFEAVNLPGPVAIAVLPHTPHAAALAEAAHRKGKEVILHIPMQPNSPRRLGPGGVTAAMDRIELMRAVSAALRSVPHVSGISNHMGSLLTSQRESMSWLMDLLRVRGNLFFVDSRTTRTSRALEVARERGVPSATRDVFLDTELDPAAIIRAFDRLVEIARRRGAALAIGHPYEQTLAVLRRMIPRLKASGIDLVPVAAVIRTRKSLQPPMPSGPRFRAFGAIGAGRGDRLTYFPPDRIQSWSPGHAASTK